MGVGYSSMTPPIIHRGIQLRLTEWLNEDKICVNHLLCLVITVSKSQPKWKGFWSHVTTIAVSNLYQVSKALWWPNILLNNFAWVFLLFVSHLYIIFILYSWDDPVGQPSGSQIQVKHFSVSLHIKHKLVKQRGCLIGRIEYLGDFQNNIKSLNRMVWKKNLCWFADKICSE